MLPGKRLILLTAFGSDEVRVEAEAVGALYREKPISRDDLLGTVQIPHLEKQPTVIVPKG